MKKHLLFFGLISLLFTTLQAQERYIEPVFDEVTVHSNIVYSDVSNFYMDIYEPVGDTLSQRPLIVFAHGGAFIAGDPRTPTATALCTEMAKRGYVAASIQYTLAPSIINLTDTLYIMNVVVAAVADAKAAIRYMTKDAANDNLYRIDTDKIFISGNSAGAILAMHLGYLDNGDVLPSHLQTILDNNGGFEGNKGNDGYPSAVKAVVNLAGGLNTLSLIDSKSPPTFSAHGSNDGIVPYNCNDVYWGQTELVDLAEILGLNSDLVDICGSSEIHPILEQLNIANELYTIEGADHTPWEANDAMRLEIIQMAADFLAPLAVAPLIPTNTASLSDEAIISIAPNPANEWINIVLNNTQQTTVSLYDLTGKKIKTSIFNGQNNIHFNCANLPTGMYVLQIMQNNAQVQTQLIGIN